MNKLRVLSRFHALSPLQTFGIRSFCAKSMRKTASSSCLDARQMCASVCASTRLHSLDSLFFILVIMGGKPVNMSANAHASIAFAAAWLAVLFIVTVFP
jgi:hypothetical protein